MAGASSALTSATTSVYIGTTFPTTLDAAGYGAVTWLKIGEISSVGTLGGKTNVIKHIPVDTGVVVKRGGSQDFGTLNLQLARHAGADITALNSAFKSRASTAFKIAYPTALGQTDYFTAIVAGTQTNVGNADQILGYAVDLEIDSEIVVVP